MGIGRYLLTLIAAAVASMVIYFLFNELPSLVATFGMGDPQLLAGQISAAIMDYLLALIGIAILGYLLWRLVSFLYLRPASAQKPLRAYAIAGVATHLVLFAASEALYVIGSEGMDTDGLFYAFLVVVLAGTVWGTVFWAMDPRAHADHKNMTEAF